MDCGQDIAYLLIEHRTADAVIELRLERKSKVAESTARFFCLSRCIWHSIFVSRETLFLFVFLAVEQ
jgi:hypothetical protein